MVIPLEIMSSESLKIVKMANLYINYSLIENPHSWPCISCLKTD